ncbi:MAG: hypothetical protein MK198_04505 [Gracilimonas sp.]|uniref:hypothetical protein n=1 Tax=Gracilimonas sp. TaxID=1974203 RepID=UPI0037504DD4|nr:hypothetical protein [Gracilimonas sp.]
METKQIIETFFEEQLGETSQYFLYKDKKLLNEGRYVEFAEEQLAKAKKIFLSVSFPLLICSWYGTISLIEYGADPNWFDLTIGLGFWVALAGVAFYAPKEYYTIKSSMNLFIKMMKEKESG